MPTKPVYVDELKRFIDVADDATPEQIRGAYDMAIKHGDNPPSEQPVIERFLSNYWNQLNPAPVIESLATTGGMSAVKGMSDAMKQQRAMATEDLQKGKYGSWLQHSLGGTVPLVGPNISGMMDQAASGDIAGSLGSAAGFSTGAFALPKAIGAGKEALASKMTRAGRGYDLAGTNIPQSYGEMTGNRLAQGAEKLVSQTSPMRQLRMRQQTALVQGANNIADQISSFRGTPEQFGQALEPQIGAYKQAMETQFENGYGQFDQSAAGIQPQTGGIKATVRPMYNQLQDLKQLLAPSDVAPMEATMQRILDGPDQVSFKTMQQYRSALMEMADKYTGTDVLRGKRAGMAANITKAADTAMEDALVQQGSPSLLADWRALNKDYSIFKDNFNEGIMGKLLENRQPEGAYNLALAKKTSLRELRALKQSIPTDLYNNLQREAVKHIIQKSISEDGALAQGGAGTTNTQQMIKGSSIRDSLYKLNDTGKADLLLDPLTKDRLLQIAKMSEKYQIPAGTLLSQIASALPAGAGAGLAGGVAMHGMAAGGVAAGGAVAALPVVARLLADPIQGAKIVRYIGLAAQGSALAPAVLNDIANKEAFRQRIAAMVTPQTPTIQDAMQQFQQLAPAPSYGPPDPMQQLGRKYGVQ